MQPLSPYSVLNQMPSTCTWRGSGSSHGQCHEAEVTLIHSPHGNKKGLSSGQQAFCCESNTWAKLGADKCGWSDDCETCPNERPYAVSSKEIGLFSTCNIAISLGAARMISKTATGSARAPVTTMNALQLMLRSAWIPPATLAQQMCQWMEQPSKKAPKNSNLSSQLHSRTFSRLSRRLRMFPSGINRVLKIVRVTLKMPSSLYLSMDQLTASPT